MIHPTRPGQLCRIIGSHSWDNGLGKGPNWNKQVTTVRLHQMQANDCVPVWQVSGRDLVSAYGAVGDEVACLNYWLEVIDPPPIAPLVAARDVELLT